MARMACRPVSCRAMARKTVRTLLLAGAVLWACAPSKPTEARWNGPDGKPADPAAVRAVRDRCKERVQVASRAGPGESQEWGLEVLDCMRGEGYVQVPAD
jgi:hypothetical protein